MIESHLPFYRSLEQGVRDPVTAAQRHFLAVCLGQVRAETAHEFAYVKFRKLLAEQRKLEAVASGQDWFGEGIPLPGWFSDEGWRRMRGHYLSNSK